MTPAQLTAARATLGQMWRLGRPVLMSELGRVLRAPARDPGEQIANYEAGRTRIPGGTSVAIDMMLAGALPPDGLAALRGATRPPPPLDGGRVAKAYLLNCFARPEGTPSHVRSPIPTE